MDASNERKIGMVGYCALVVLDDLLAGSDGIRNTYSLITDRFALNPRKKTQAAGF